MMFGLKGRCHRQAWQLHDVFIGEVQRLATAQQQRHARCRRPQRQGQLTTGLQQVFAAIEHQQYPATFESPDQGLGFQAQRAGNPCPHLARLGDSRQVDEPRTVVKVFQQQFRDPQYHGGLANAAWAGHGGQALAWHLDQQPAQHFIAADHRAQPCRQIVLFTYGRSQRRGKAIAPPRIVEDVPAPVPPVTERPTQRGNVHPQVDVFHHTVRPDPGDERLLADIAAGVIHQHLENVQRPPAQGERFAVSGDQPLLPVEGKRTEAHRRFGIGFDETVHGDPVPKSRCGHGVAVIGRVCLGSLASFPEGSPLSWQPTTGEQCWHRVHDGHHGALDGHRRLN
ncbi:hypothetical protein BN844_1050 [Pseudomonas sp. SHC52]|nr:hypothetical protein BN844_1050 [Pseudomonas sp. SHC52]